jgi:hypothetical protein
LAHHQQQGISAIAGWGLHRALAVREMLSDGALQLEHIELREGLVARVETRPNADIRGYIVVLEIT